MNIGIIGSGGIGSCLATRFVKLGHSVSIANSRGPAPLKKFTADIQAEAATVEEAIKNKEVVIIYWSRRYWVFLSSRYSIPFLQIACNILADQKKEKAALL